MNQFKRIVSMILAFVMLLGFLPVSAGAAETDATLAASLEKAKAYIDGITINSSSNDPATVVKNFKTHFTWDNEKRENSKSYLFDWSYYNGVVFEGIEYVYEVTGESKYKDYVLEYMSSMITSSGGWATCSNNSSKQCAGYNSTHGADCYMTAALLVDCYEMTGDNRYLTMANTLYADLDNAAKTYLLKNAGNNFRHTWASDPSPDLWLDGLYMILPFRAEYAKYIGDQEELDLIVSRMQWVSDNMYNSSKKLFYHAADSASSNSGTYWLRSIGWYAAAIVDIMDSMEGSNLEAMKVQLKKLVDGMKACQNTSNGMWLNNMNASQSSSNPYETSGTALTCYAVMKAVNNGWLDESYADMAILAFNGICREKLSGSNLKDICFKGAPGSSNSTFYDNEGKGVGPFIMFYAEMLEYVNKAQEEPEPTVPETTEPEETEPEVTEPEVTKPTEPEPTEPEPTEPSEPEEEEFTYSGSGNLEYYEEGLGGAVSSITSGTSYYLVNTKANKTLTGTANGSRLVMSGTQDLANTNRWYITQASGNTYYVQYGGPSGKYLTVGNDSAALTSTRTALTLTYDSANGCWDIGSGNYHLNDYRAEHNYASGYTAGSSSDNGSRWAFYPVVAVVPSAQYVLDTDGINSGEKYIIVYSGKALQNNNGVDSNPGVTISNNTITLSDDSTYGWTITANGSNYNVENNGSYLNLTKSGDDPIGTTATVYIARSGSTYTFRNANGSGAYLRYSSSQLFCAGTSNSNNGMSLYRRVNTGTGAQVLFTISSAAEAIKPGNTLGLNATVTVAGTSVNLSNCTISWSSSNSSVATVSNGVVTGVASGNASITATLTAANGKALKDPIVLTVNVTVQGHDYVSVVTEPTCTEQGYTTYTCTICGDSYTENYVDALGHSYEAVVTAPTCTEAGYTTYTCHCGDSYVADEVAALGHSYESVTTEPTCTLDGKIVYTCHCGDTYTEVIPALGHSYEAVVTAPTCTEAGFTTYTCACGDSYLADEVAALGHTYESVTTEPTCTVDGKIVYTCHCGDSYTKTLPALGHSYEAVVTAPTCTEAGFTTYTCACGHTYTADEVAALGHTYKTETIAPTCTVNGVVIYTCHCGDSYTKTLPALGHSYEAVVTAPTCTKAGFTTYTCACGHTYTADEVAALGHSYKTETIAPTCTVNGVVIYTCHCGDSYTKTLPALGHSYEAVVTAPTCTEIGFTTHTCHCGDSYITDETAALGHSYQTVTLEPTCECDGSVTDTCAVCGHQVVEVIPALGHSYEAVVTAPTCTEIGFTTYTCHCGHTYIADEVAALGHTYESVTTKPTCTVDGKIVYTCHCGNTYTEVIPAPGHRFEAITIAPTCTEIGFTTYTCHCGESYVADEVPALGHTYESVTTEPTCTLDGKIVHTCACGDTYTEVIPALGHSYEAVVTAATCTEAGYTTYTCVCGDSYVADEVAALGHSYQTVTLEPTCETAGCTTHTCTVCGESYVSDEIPALGHTYDAVVTAPTCTEAGFTTYTCHCGHTYIADEVAALGHTYESVTTEPTCTENGKIVYTCHCGDTYTEVIPALGHSYEAVVTAPTCTEAGYTTYTCACGHTYTADEVPALGHTYESVTTEPTCTVDGKIVYTCHCGDAYTEVIPAPGHRFEAITIAPTCTEKGTTTYICACGKIDVIVEVPALGHSHEAVVTEPTCTEAGFTTYTCHCGDTYTADEVDALGHIYQAVTVEPTCVADGSVTSKCAVCGHETVKVLPALGHSYETVVTAPTCTAVGYTTYTCHCGDTYAADQVAAMGHSYDAAVTAPTCTEAGFTTYTCHCGDSYVADQVASLGHDYTCVEENGFLIYTCGLCGDSYTESVAWISVGKSYVLDTNGVDIGKDHKYLVVGSNQNYALTVSGSTVGSAAVTIQNNTITLDNASNYEFYFVNNSSKESGSYLLTKDGSKTVYHEVGEMYYGNDNKGYWHFGSSSNGSYQIYDDDWGTWYLNYGYVWASNSVSRFAVSSNARSVRLFQATENYARLSGEGFQTYDHTAGATLDLILGKLSIQRSLDGETVSEVLNVTSDLVSWDKPFSGVTAGTYTGTITYQGVVLGSVQVTITGEHTYETVTTAPTCTTSGATVHTCTGCGHSYQENVVEALGHSYNAVEADGCITYTCTRCAHSYSEKLNEYAMVSSLTAGQSHVITVYANGVYYALSHAGNSISLVQVNVSGSEITSEITEDLLWTYQSSKLSYVSAGKTYYMYCYTNSWWGGWWGNSGTSLQLSTSNSSTVSFSSNKLKIGSYYLNYSNGSVNLNRSASTTYVFAEN